jgi:hypothetical protein
MMAMVRLYQSEWPVWVEGDDDWMCELDIPDALLVAYRRALADFEALSEAIDKLQEIQQPSWA